MVGFCDNAVLTEYHPTGTLGDFIENDPRYEKMSLLDRIKLAHRYVEILEFLHDSPIGTRVMCDSNRIKGTVKQYLVTEDGDIVVNDLGMQKCSALTQPRQANKFLLQTAFKSDFHNLGLT